MAAGAALPTLSQVQTLDTAYLREAAEHWTRAGHLWEQTFGEVHNRISTPGDAAWTGQAAAAAHERSYLDLVKVRDASDQLHGAAAVAARGEERLQACIHAVLEAVEDARADGFSVGEDYSVTDRMRGGSSEFRAARLAVAQGHASFIRHRVAALVTGDHELAARIAAATKDIEALSFPETSAVDGTTAREDERNKVRAVDNHTFKEAPNPEPDPPTGGWSDDPLMRAAQKIAYGHASSPNGHMDDFPGMTKDQLADLVYGKLKRSIENPDGLRLGPSSTDRAPVIYDPRDNVLIIRDTSGVGGDCGTVFKPDLQARPNYVDQKFGGSVGSFEHRQLADEPLPTPSGSRPAPPPAAGGEPAPTKPPAGPPVETPPVKPLPVVGEGGGGMPGLPFGGGLSIEPHVIHPHKPGQHHGMPLFGELPDDNEQ
ncbi:hypothetical protein [Mycobacterium sp. 852002-51057_SCH5723018]|uniref:hypothetical protein n=1 Tax=Mycobacterium sp. 852002-51057_SCH5723018 TaxID=1834094 RepID=UPI0007FD16F7|nr:hypothetical protein [Mycobacterium sp. 852002-51057_SCH5723018]OBG25189.1 hypothetical protein A5764_07265 [Mycobacterium sp. 852002-51057_SCH5723018]